VIAFGTSAAQLHILEAIMLQLNVNGQSHEVAMESDTPLLWVLRDGHNLTGTKCSCGIASCGSCAVLVDGKPVRSLPIRLES
jgi:isoquinoline 1-oxidoreductase alpha subunit